MTKQSYKNFTVSQLNQNYKIEIANFVEKHDINLPILTFDDTVINQIHNLSKYAAIEIDRLCTQMNHESSADEQDKALAHEIKLKAASDKLLDQQTNTMLIPHLLIAASIVSHNHPYFNRTYKDTLPKVAHFVRTVTHEALHDSFEVMMYLDHNSYEVPYK